MPHILHKHADRFLAAALFVAALGVYLCTLCPTLYWGDCGELAAAAYTLGITHPTGYPVWCLLSKAWTLVFPFGTIIWRLNVWSAVCGALAASFLFGAGRALGLPRPVALAAAALFAFSATFWQQCLFCETYSLTACYTAALLFLALRWRARGCAARDLFPLALAYGFALTNGQINTLFVPGFLAFVLLCSPNLGRLRDSTVRRLWLRLLGAALLPLLFYAYLPLRALAHPAVNWGDPRTPFAFYYHVTGRPFAGLMFHMPLSVVWRNTVSWAGGLSNEYVWPLFVPALIGLFAAWRRAPAVAVLLTWIMLADVVYAVNYEVYNRYIYFIPFYAVVALLIGQGLWAFWPRLAAAVAPEKRRFYQAFAAISLLLLAPFQCGAHWGHCDLHRVWACYDYGRNILASLPQDSILIDNGQDTSHSAVQYLQVVEHDRPDVVDIQRQLLLGIYDLRLRRFANLWYWNSLTRRAPYLNSLYPPGALTPHAVWHEDLLHSIMAQAVAAGRPIAVLRPVQQNPIDYRTGHFVPLLSFLVAEYDPAPVGIVMRLYPHGKRPADTVLREQTESAWHRYTLHGFSGGAYLQDEYLVTIALDYATASLSRARLAYAQGDYDTAETAYHFVLRLFRSPEAAAGLERCADARRKRIASVRPAPRLEAAWPGHSQLVASALRRRTDFFRRRYAGSHP